jgi:hypothetical protein
MSSLHVTALTIGLFAGMLCLLEVGRQLGRYWIRKKWHASEAAFVGMEGAVFGLMGLLIAFTFSAAASRFETKRQLLVEEINDIGTAWLRLDLLPPADQPVLREDFRRYVESRQAAFRKVRDPEAVRQILSQTQTLQSEIWSRAVRACRDDSSPAITSLVLTSMNTMFDVATSRTMAERTHQPWLISMLLFVSPLICALIAGIDCAASPHRSLVRLLGFALSLSITIFVIFDLEYPRAGLIRIDPFDQGLVELRNSMAAGK